MEQTVIRIGNSAGVIIPKNVLEQLGLRPGEKIVFQKSGRRLILSPKRRKIAGGVNQKFMKMVDEFILEHEDTLKKLAKL